MSNYDVAQDSHIGVWRCRFSACLYSVSVGGSEDFVTDGRASKIALPSVVDHMEREHGPNVRTWLPRLRALCDDPDVVVGPDVLLEAESGREVDR